MAPSSNLALYTTVYPGVESFLPDWFRSVCEQTDQDFQLWIGLDQMTIEAVRKAAGSRPRTTWIHGAPGDTPAQVRQRAFERLVNACDAAVLVDCDDVMHPSRIASARAMLRVSDLAGCGLRLVDQHGADLGVTLRLPPGTGPDAVLPRHNVFGLSNTAVRSDVLRRCLPIPAAVTLVDWYLASTAWLVGVRLDFDNDAGMDYRQHGANMVRVIPPFDATQVAQDTGRLRRHFRLVQASAPADALPHRLAEVACIAADIERFHQGIVLKPTRLKHYVQALNALGMAPLWGACVAHPLLRHMWTSGKETP